MHISIHKQNLIGLKKRQNFEAHEEVVVEMLTKGLAFLAIIASFAVGKSFRFQDGWPFAGCPVARNVKWKS